MSQVTIYLQPDALAAVKSAARQAELSLSQWFARHAQAEVRAQANEVAAFWEGIDQARLGDTPVADAQPASGWDELLSATRQTQDLSPLDARESF